MVDGIMMGFFCVPSELFRKGVNICFCPQITTKILDLRFARDQQQHNNCTDKPRIRLGTCRQLELSTPPFRQLELAPPPFRQLELAPPPFPSLHFFLDTNITISP